MYHSQQRYLVRKSRRGRQLQFFDSRWKFQLEFRHTAANFQQKILWVLKISTYPLNPTKMRHFSKKLRIFKQNFSDRKVLRLTPLLWCWQLSKFPGKCGQPPPYTDKNKISNRIKKLADIKIQDITHKTQKMQWCHVFTVSQLENHPVCLEVTSVSISANRKLEAKF